MWPRPAVVGALAAVAAALLPALARSAEAAEELRESRTYRAGVRVASTPVGVSFVVPEGWIGKYAERGGARTLVLGSNTIEGVGMVILQTGQSADDLARQLGQPQDLGAGVVLQPTGPVAREGDRVTVAYESGPYVGRALGVVDAGRSVVCFFSGPRARDGVYALLVEALERSTTFQRTAPAPSTSEDRGEAVERWSSLVRGQALHRFSTYRSGAAGGGMASHDVLHLCEDGRFIYSGDSAVTMNVPGATGSSGRSGGARGSWRVERGAQGSAVLVLADERGGERRLELRYEAKKLFLGGQRWLREQSAACR